MVVEKVDRPEPVPAYEIKPTARTKDEREQKKRGEEEKDEFSQGAGVPGWQKFSTSAKNRKSVKLSRHDIARLWFRQVALQKGIIIVELDIGLKNGQVLKAAHTFLTKLDDYWKLKALVPGQEVPIHEIVREAYVEITIPHKGGVPETETTGRHALGSIERRKTGEKGLLKLIDPKTGGLNMSAIIFYAAILIAIVALIMIIL